MIKFLKRYFTETREKNETISGHKHNAHMYSSRFQKLLFNESALSRFEVLTNTLHKCKKDRPYCATHYQDIFTQYNDGFNFITGKEAHVTIPEGPTPVTPYTKANI